MVIFSMGIFTRLPIWSQTLFRNGLVTELSPNRNGYPLWCGNPHMDMGIGLFLIPIWQWSSSISIWGCASPRFYMVIPGNPRFHAGIDVFTIPVWKRGDPVSKWGFVNPRYHTVIPGNPHIRTCRSNATTALGWVRTKAGREILVSWPKF